MPLYLYRQKLCLVDHGIVLCSGSGTHCYVNSRPKWMPSITPSLIRVYDWMTCAIIRSPRIFFFQKHMQDVATGLALQTLDLDVQRRKWSLTVQGLKGEENEDEEKTRDICAKLSKECLHVKDASTTDFAACHRLSRQADSGVIIRFKDLRIRNQWLAGAKNLKTRADRISISPDLLPTLRSLKKDLLEKRSQMPPEQKGKHSLRYIRQWPYVVLAGPGNTKIQPSVSKESVVMQVLGVSPCLVLNEPTGPR